MIVTLDEIKTVWLNTTSTEHDTQLNILIAQASSMVKDLCRQPIEQESITLYFNGDNATKKDLPYTSDITVTSLAYKVSETETSYTTISSSDYFLERSTLYLPDTFKEARYRLVLEVGYATIPSAIVSACSELVVWLYSRTNLNGSSTIGLLQDAQTSGGMTQTKVYKDLVKDLESRLAPYTIFPM